MEVFQYRGDVALGDVGRWGGGRWDLVILGVFAKHRDSVIP